MAKIKLKFGENEIEVDSRDFYVDNQTLGEVIENLAKLMEENQTKPIYENPPSNPIINESNFDSLNSLEDVEISTQYRYISTEGIPHPSDPEFRHHQMIKHIKLHGDLTPEQIEELLKISVSPAHKMIEDGVQVFTFRDRF